MTAGEFGSPRSSHPRADVLSGFGQLSSVICEPRELSWPYFFGVTRNVEVFGRAISCTSHTDAVPTASVTSTMIGKTRRERLFNKRVTFAMIKKDYRVKSFGGNAGEAKRKLFGYPN